MECPAVPVNFRRKEVYIDNHKEFVDFPVFTWKMLNYSYFSLQYKQRVFSVKTSYQHK